MVSIQPNGDIRVNETIEMRGYTAANARRMLKEYQNQDYSMWGNALFAAYARNTELEKIEVRSLSKNDAPLIIQMRYVQKDVVHHVKDNCAIRLPDVWLRHFLGVNSINGRKTPFQLRVPFQMKSITWIDVLEGQIADMENHAEHSSSSYTEWNSTLVQEEGRIGLSLDVTLKPGIHPPESYSAYKADIEKALSTMTRSIIFSKKRKSPAAP
jgi:hypothetical protein